MSDEIKQAILDFMNKSSKKKLSIKDVTKGLQSFDKKLVKTEIKAMTESEELMYWSSGSTVYVVLPENYHADEE